MKLTIGRIFEISRVVNTKAGGEIKDFIEWVSTASEQFVRALRNGLTFYDNMQCIVKTVSVSSDVSRAINTGGKKINSIIISRVYSSVYAVDHMLWYYSSDGNLYLKVGFTNSPSGDVEIDILMFY